MSRDIDTHELLKREAFASASAASDAHFEKSRPSPYEPHGASDQYVILDSWEKDLGNSRPGRGVLAWNFNVQGSTTSQAIGVRDVIDTVTEIQLGSFTIPLVMPFSQAQNPVPGGILIPGCPRLTLGTDASNAIDPLSATFGWLSPYVDRVTIELKEIGLQAVSQRGGVRYHFEADVIAVFTDQGTNSSSLGTSLAGLTNPFPNALRIVPLPGFDTYRFTDPIQDVHGLTLQFRAVDKPVPFPLDVVTGVQAYTSPALWPNIGFLLPATGLEFWETLLYIGASIGLGRIAVSGLATADPKVNAWLNQEPGLLAQIPDGFAPGIGINTDDVTAAINGEIVPIVPAPYVNIATLVPAAPAVVTVIPSATPVTLRFLAGRTRIPMRFRRMISRTTNYA